MAAPLGIVPMCGSSAYEQRWTVQVHVRVVYLDNSSGPAGGGGLACDIHDFKPDHLSAVYAAPPVHVLYRPGHYDILYPAL